MFIKNMKFKRNSDEPMFIFYFESEEEFLSTIKGLRKMAKFFEGERFSQLVDTLESRVNDKYANDEVALSGMLFCSEMAQFTSACVMLLDLFGNNNPLL